MISIYLKPEDFNKIKPIKKFPNDGIIIGHLDNDINTELLYMVRAGSISVYEIVENPNHFGCTNKHVLLESSTGHFPTDLIATVNPKTKSYEDGLNVGLVLHGNMGTATVGVIDYETCLDILTKNNWTINNK